MHGGDKKYVYDPYEMWGMSKDGEEVKVDSAVQGGIDDGLMNDDIDYDELV